MWLKPLFAHTSKNAKSGFRKWHEVLPGPGQESKKSGPEFMDFESFLLHSDNMFIISFPWVWLSASNSVQPSFLPSDRAVGHDRSKHCLERRWRRRRLSLSLSLSLLCLSYLLLLLQIHWCGRYFLGTEPQAAKTAFLPLSLACDLANILPRSQTLLEPKPRFKRCQLRMLLRGQEEREMFPCKCFPHFILIGGAFRVL
jgi:hypothetical protein